MDKRFYIDGKVLGKLNNLRIPKVEFKTLSNTHLITSASIKGLPDMDKMYLVGYPEVYDRTLLICTNLSPSLLPDSIQLPHVTSAWPEPLKEYDWL